MGTLVWQEVRPRIADRQAYALLDKDNLLPRDDKGQGAELSSAVFFKKPVIAALGISQGVKKPALPMNRVATWRYFLRYQ
jgi:hypothetical protein